MAVHSVKQMSVEQNVGDVPTQERPLHLLGFFSRERPLWGLGELAVASGLPKASCLRALRVLEHYNLVQRSGSHYRLGARLISLGTLVQESYPPRRVALPHLEALRDATGQSAQWVVREGVEGVYIDVVEALARVRLFIAPGRRAPLYAGASTRLLLAYAPSEIQDEVFSKKRRRYTAETPVEAARLRGLLHKTRATGFAASYGELELFSAELAAPVVDALGDTVAAVSLAGAEAHYRNGEILGRYLHYLDETARKISLELGFNKPWHSDLEAFLLVLKEQRALSADEGR